MNSSKSYFDGIKWVFVDLDDTLWDFTKNSSQSLNILYNSEPLLSKLYPDYSEYDEKYHFKNSELWHKYHHGEISQDYLKKERFRWLLIQKGANFENIDNESARLNDKYLTILGEQIAVVDGAEELLQYLSKKYLIGILSNGFMNVQYNKLYGTNIHRYIQRMVVSDEIGVQKPDIRIFDYALQAVGAVADEVVLIGDNPDADIKGAINAGWHTIYFDRNEKGITEVIPNAIVKDLRDVIELL